MQLPLFTKSNRRPSTRPIPNRSKRGAPNEFPKPRRKAQSHANSSGSLLPRSTRDNSSVSYSKLLSARLPSQPINPPRDELVKTVKKKFSKVDCLHCETAERKKQSSRKVHSIGSDEYSITPRRAARGNRGKFRAVVITERALER